MIMHWKNIVKIAVPLKATYRFNPRQDSNGIFTEEKKILKFIWNYKKKTLNSQSNTEKKTTMLEASQFLNPNYTILRENNKSIVLSHSVSNSLQPHGL